LLYNPIGDRVPLPNPSHYFSTLPQRMTKNKKHDRLKIIGQGCQIAALVYLLITAVSSVSLGFELSAGDRVHELFAFATNPLAGLVVGILTTAIVQSSSTVTSVIVSLVAAGLPVAAAIPMVMGANIGTTITNILVSLGHIRQSEEFKRAFAAASIHDFFNLLCVTIFLPLELTTHFLEKSASALSNSLTSSLWLGSFNLTDTITQPALQLLQSAARYFGHPLDGIFLIVVGILLIFLSIFYLSYQLKKLASGPAKAILHRGIGRGSISGIASGAIVTAIVQSSSTTTSLIVPLAGMGLLTLEEVYPFTLGANIGTCVTALLAATAVADTSSAAIEIALVHLLFNVCGVLVIYGLPVLRQIPIAAAKALSHVASQRRVLAISYVLGAFFILPIFLLGLTSRLNGL
jgi:solute carrier family 34 (sodium-dependent phosphate cotransporter)